MKVNTISLNSVRLNTIALNHIGEIRSGGGGSKPSPIPQWIREHISFYYDMSKPMDVYPDDFGKWTKSTDSTFKVTSTNITITNLKAEKVSSVYIGKGGNFKGMKIRVSGLVDGQELYWGYWNNSLLRIPSNGDYTLSPIEQAVDNLGIRSGNIVGDCNITIEMLPSGKSVPTNEILKVSGYLQDLSGRKRNMKLNNFLFDMMSGVDGYKNESFETVPGNTNIKWKHLSYYSIQGKPTQKATDFGLYRVKNNANKFLYLKWNIEGIQEGNKVYLAQYNNESTRIELTNGVSDIALDMTNSDNPGYGYVVIISDQPYSTDITITQIPEYPGALVTDGVDDYGLVKNLSNGVKMLFMTINTSSPNRYIYEQRKEKDILTFSVLGKPGGDDVAYNWKNNGHTYIDGVLNNTITSANLLNKKHILTIVNDDVTVENTKTPRYFATDFENYPSKLAFYNSIAFDSIPTEADGFTEQELIDYVITNIIGQ
jgi:hypothetical protein|nr:MAG TPA: hypothetical protein [Caudoviricetes sp.]